MSKRLSLFKRRVTDGSAITAQCIYTRMHIHACDVWLHRASHVCTPRPRCATPALHGNACTSVYKVCVKIPEVEAVYTS